MSDRSVASPAEEQRKFKMDPNPAGALSDLFGCLSGILIESYQG